MTLSTVMLMAMANLIAVFQPFPVTSSEPTMADMKVHRRKFDAAFGLYECFHLRAANCIEGFQPACSRGIRRWGRECVMNALDIMNSGDEVTSSRGKLLLRYECGVVCRQEEE